MSFTRRCAETKIYKYLYWNDVCQLEVSIWEILLCMVLFINSGQIDVSEVIPIQGFYYLKIFEDIPNNNLGMSITKLLLYTVLSEKIFKLSLGKSDHPKPF